MSDPAARKWRPPGHGSGRSPSPNSRLTGAMGVGPVAAASAAAGPSQSRVAGSLFYSVPTMDYDDDDDDDDDDDGHDDDHHSGYDHHGLIDNANTNYGRRREIPTLPSYVPHYDSDDDGSDSSSQSPPMSLFLDRQPLHEEPDDAPALTPAAIYLDVPPPVPTKSKASGTLGEQLLAPTAVPGPTGRTSISYKRQFKDPVFAVLYLFALASYLILGIVLLFTTSSSPLEGQIYNVFLVIKSSAGKKPVVVLCIIDFFEHRGSDFGCTVFVAKDDLKQGADIGDPVIGCSGHALASNVEVVCSFVWATVLTVPCFALAVFIWSLVSSFQGPKLPDGGRDPQDTGLTALSFLPLGVGSLFVSVIYFRRDNIARTTAIIELACEILKDNPDMFFASFGLMLAHVVFTVLWLIFFARVFLIGHVERTDSVAFWVMDGNFYPIAGFMIFIYMWTSAVLSNVQRVTLSNVVSKWYFHRHEPFNYHSSKITEPAIINAVTTSFGSICFGALFIAIVQFTRLKQRTFPLFGILAAVFQFIAGLIENFNNYTLIYVGITGESLISAARSASKIFHRNLLWGLITDFLTKLVLYISSTMLCLFTGFIAYIFATHTLKSPYGYVLGIICTIVPFYVTRFFTHIMSIT
ncbi:hypothetical protein BGW38_001001 [Lunasporangiospora selenospora]|uniref:Protein PNS1 n=1 Tax=Lunasporangiospora selenospora TaxID=979761 RepID=A0A9P6KEK2_9FUNG|nr:hypothetical protein BGW38_001001 [Lunasporangiospora selenospora]